MFNLTTKPVSAGELMKKEKKPINFVVEKFISRGCARKSTPSLFKIDFEAKLQRLLKRL